MNQPTWERPLRAALFVGALAPFLVLLVDAFTDGLGADPVKSITHRTGWWTLALLLVATVAAGLTAPEKSATQRQIEQTEALRFNPWTTGPGIRPSGWLNLLRDAAYRASQRGRQG